VRAYRATAGIGLIGLMLAACGGEKPPATTSDLEQAVVDEVVKQTGRAPSTDTTPCEILDDEFVRAHFAIDTGVEITRSPSKYSPHPLCTVSWPKPNATEIQKESAAAMSEYMVKKARGENVEMPSFRTTDEVTLTIYEPVHDTPENAMTTFDAAMKLLSEGITRSHEDVEVTFQSDLTPVDGIGDKAMWAEKMRQISVVDGLQIYHVTVNTGAEPGTELEKAKAIAKDIAGEI